MQQAAERGTGRIQPYPGGTLVFRARHQTAPAELPPAIQSTQHCCQQDQSDKDPDLNRHNQLLNSLCKNRTTREAFAATVRPPGFNNIRV
jgi:hypothetical protein